MAEKEKAPVQVVKVTLDTFLDTKSLSRAERGFQIATHRDVRFIEKTYIEWESLLFGNH